MAIVAVLGWAGFNTSEQKVGKVIDLAIKGDVTQSETQPAESVSQDTTNEAQSDIVRTPQDSNITQDFNRASAISPARRTHILYGDATGGGHLFGQNKPCKSEFPKHWNEEVIIKEVDLIAANDNLNWQQQRNGYYVTEQQVGTVKVRVVKGRNNKDVITAYPTNVRRNPCPRN